MNKYIYKVKEKFNIQVDEEGIETYDIRDIEPKLLASVPVIQPKEQTAIDEEGIETTFIPEINITRHYPIFDSELMIVSDSRFKEPILVNGVLTEGYVEPVVEEVIVEPVEPTDDEKLESLKQQIIDVTFQLYKLEISGFDAKELHIAKERLISEHKALAEIISEK